MSSHLLYYHKPLFLHRKFAMYASERFRYSYSYIRSYSNYPMHKNLNKYVSLYRCRNWHYR